MSGRDSRQAAVIPGSQGSGGVDLKLCCGPVIG